MPKPVLPPLHAPMPPKQAASFESPIPSNGWYVCIKRDVYGPYTVSQLIESVKDGRIGIDDTLLHAMATNNAWVSITRLPQVSMFIRPTAPPAMTQQMPAPVTVTSPRSTATRQQRRSSGIHWVRDVVMPLLSMLLMVAGYLHYTERQEAAMRQNVVIQTPAPIPRPSHSPKHELPRSSPKRVPVTQSIEDTSPRSSPSTRNSSEFELTETQPDFTQKNNGNLGDLLPEENATSSDQPFLVVDLDLNAGFQVVDLPEVPPNRRLTVSRFTSPTLNQESDRDKFVLSDSRPVLVLPYGNRSVFLKINGLAEAGKLSKIRIECMTDLDWLGGDTLSLDRLKRKRIALIKQGASTRQFDAFCNTLAKTFTGAKLELAVID